ncbi:hypothetical protein [cf. Phormidesmis sp. LEGE 11477]|uniref:hypothetical protein n=1 Tax=cf. Phormidesmis sp. LEGE 11477 TaxID=1828680 RepID=UPI001881F581|nr:hypothetical protein [cf. Phormidesmis sp. LEGE 11477]MBE9062240.1 hypothetical protein [cf. Phormidesmis sp. LEGE 11477]
MAQLEIEDESTTIPDITQVSIDSFGTLPESDQGVADVISLYDFSNLVDIRDMTLGFAHQYISREEAEALTLQDYSFLSEVTFAEIIHLTNSYKRDVDQFPLALVSLKTFLSHPVLASERKLTLAQVMTKYPDIGNFKLGFLELEQYGEQEIPGLLRIPLMEIPGWGDIKVSEIPGLKKAAIDASDSLDGSIVTLTISSKDDQEIVLLKDSSGLTLEWSQQPADGLRPFDSYLAVPTISDEKIAVSAYFPTCGKQAEALECNLIGPFPYGQYAEGDSIYVSAKDWSLADEEERLSAPETTEEEGNLPDTATQPLAGQAQFLKVLIAAGLGTALVGLLAFYFMLRGLFGKKKA